MTRQWSTIALYLHLWYDNYHKLVSKDVMYVFGRLYITELVAKPDK